MRILHISNNVYLPSKVANRILNVNHYSSYDIDLHIKLNLNTRTFSLISRCFVLKFSYEDYVILWENFLKTVIYR